VLQEYWYRTSRIQAIIRSLLLAEGQVQSKSSSCEVSGGQSLIMIDFLRALRFPLLIFTPPNVILFPISSGIDRMDHL
jgi:hypothetical protein